MRAMHHCQALLPVVLLFSLVSTTHAANFTFDFGTPTQCDNFPISWTGGSPPFELVLVPPFGTPRTFSVPSANFTNGQGFFQAQVPFATNKTFLAIMSDANGYGTGGVSNLLTVGAPVSNTNCNTTDPGVEFFFELNTSLQQCRPYTFDGYTGAVQPITITGVIPGGQTFILDVPSGPTSFDWDADVAAGTSIMWIMTDSKGRQGGSSDVLKVAISDDATCLSTDSPTSLSTTPSATASGSSTSSTTSAGASSSNSSAGESAGNTSTTKSNTGAIVGGVLAGLFGISAIVVLILFLLRRNRRSLGYSGGSAYPYGSRRNGRLRSVDLDAPAVMEDGHPAATINPYPFAASGAVQSGAGAGAVSHNMSASVHELLPRNQDAQYQRSQYQGSQYLGGSQFDGQTQYTTSMMNPYSAGPSETSFAQRQRRPSSEMGGGSVLPGGSASSMTSSARNKAAMAGVATYKPTRYIVHTDLEEAQPPDEGAEVVELPPQYSERRGPLRGVDDYVAPPPGSPSNPANPLEAVETGPSSRLQEPIQPATPASPAPYPYKS